MVLINACIVRNAGIAKEVGRWVARRVLWRAFNSSEAVANWEKRVIWKAAEAQMVSEDSHMPQAHQSSSHPACL